MYRPEPLAGVPRLEAVAAPAVLFEHVSFSFDDHAVLRDLSFEVPRGSTRILLGASGAGKSVVLKLILGLWRPDASRIFVNGQRIDNMRERDLLRLRADIGMLFQETALFDSLTVAENVGYRLSEETDMTAAEVDNRVEEVLGFIGLGEYTDRLPSALSAASDGASRLREPNVLRNFDWASVPAPRGDHERRVGRRRFEGERLRDEIGSIDGRAEQREIDERPRRQDDVVRPDHHPSSSRID
jgi:ABC-type uncharacterized transport system YnjBCD ATPase subunit